MQLVVSVVGLVGLGFNYRFRINWKNQGFRAALKLLPMRSMDQGIDYVTGIFNTNLASRMGEQSIRAFQQASSLQSMPVNLIGVAISTAYFSQLSQDAARKDREIFMRTFRKALRAIIWIAMPVAILAFFERGYVVNFIKNGGDPKIASVLGSFVVAIFCSSCFHIASRGFYARQDTRTPFTISVITFIVQSAVMFGLFKLGFGPEGLAYAVSFGTVLELSLLLVFQNRAMDHKLFNAEFWSAIIRIAIASAVAGVVCYIMTRLMPLRIANNSFFSTFPKFCIITAISGVAYLIVCVILRVEEVKPVFAYLKRILFRNSIKK